MLLTTKTSAIVVTSYTGITQKQKKTTSLTNLLLETCLFQLNTLLLSLNDPIQEVKAIQEQSKVTIITVNVFFFMLTKFKLIMSSIQNTRA